MKKTAILFAALFVLFALPMGCGNNPVMPDDDDDIVDPPDDGKIHFTAAYAEVSSVTIYKEDGIRLASYGGDEGISLDPGDYYVDIRDEFGKALYNQYANPTFVPGVTNAELILEPVSITHSDELVVRLRVHPDGYTPKFMGVSSDRGKVVWETTYAMYGRYASRNYQFTQDFEQASFFPYLTDKRQEWELLDTFEFDASKKSCRETIDEGDLSILGCYVNYGFNDPLPNFNEQDDVSDGVCADTGCCGGKSLPFTMLVGYNAEVMKNHDGSYKTFPKIALITNGGLYPRMNSETIKAGDFVYESGTSSASFPVVVRVTGDSVVLFDSDEVGGEGHELVGLRTLPNTEDGLYFIKGSIDCLYEETCSE